MRTTDPTCRTKLAAVASIGFIAVGVTACGDDGDSGSSGSSSSKSAPKPVAALDAVQGKSTAIKLDKGFTDALTALKLTPGVTGDGQLTDDGSLVFPITGGNVTVFKPRRGLAVRHRPAPARHLRTDPDRR